MAEAHIAATLGVTIVASITRVMRTRNRFMG